MGNEPPFSSEEDFKERTLLSQMTKNSKGSLSWRAKYKIEYLLRNIGTKRVPIAQIMAFAIDHADAAEEVFNDESAKHYIFV
jgi:hypothetical protein